MLVRAYHPQHGFHGYVLATCCRAISFALQGNDLIAAITSPFTHKHRGLIIAYPHAVERLLNVVKAQQRLSRERPAHHFAVELLLQKAAVEREVGFGRSRSYFWLACRVHPTFHFGFPISH